MWQSPLTCMARSSIDRVIVLESLGGGKVSTLDVIIVSIKLTSGHKPLKTHNSRWTSVVVCTDVSGNEPVRQVSVVRVIALGSLGGIMVSTLLRNAKGVGSNPSLETLFPTCINPTTGRVKPMTYQLRLATNLARYYALLRYGKDWLAQC